MASQKKTSWGFDLSTLDTSVRPQDDFYRYANGGWLKKNPIPPTESRWGSFNMLANETEKRLKGILDELETIKSEDPDIQKLQLFYRTSTDQKLRNKAGIQPLLSDFQKIQSIQNTKDLIECVAYLHRTGAAPLWSIIAGPDDKKSDQYILFLAQGGLSLPDRDYYLKNDEKSKKIRSEFLNYFVKLWKLMDSKQDAQKYAEIILKLETKLARASMSRVELRDPEKQYNKMNLSGLSRLASGIAWKEYFGFLGLEKVNSLVVCQPKFMTAVAAVLKATPLEDLKVYLQWKLLNAMAFRLSDPFVKARFGFYGAVIQGMQKLKPLWQRALGDIDECIDEPLGKLYVEKYFSSESKKQVNEMVDHLTSVYEKRIKALDWMEPKTKKQALKKLSTITRKLGYPDAWKNYKSLELVETSYVENFRTAYQIEFDRVVQRAGKPVDRNEWLMPVYTVNAYYSSSHNNIAFPAGIIQHPFFDPKADTAINYGAMGSVIGHELTHGFDDEGSKYDEKGNLRKWWTVADRKRFEKKASLIVRQFNKEKVIDNLYCNGKLTLGENIADLGGAVLAYEAYQEYLKQHNDRKVIDGFTPEQRFFLGLAQCERQNIRPEEQRRLVMVDPHSPAYLRINVPFSNMTEFYEAFDVQPKDLMYRPTPQRAKIW